MMKTRYLRLTREKRPASQSAAAQEVAREKMWENIAGYGTIIFFILFCVGSIPFGYDPPRVLLFIVGMPLLIVAALGGVAAFVCLILAILFR
jgi:hypothetical protein